MTIALLVVCVGLLALNGFQLHLASKREDKHREDVQTLIASAMTAKGVPYAPTIKDDPEPAQQFTYSDDGLEAWPVMSDG